MGLRLRPEGEDWSPQGSAQGWVFAQHQPREAKYCPEGGHWALLWGQASHGHCGTFQAQRGEGDPLAPVSVENIPREILLFTFRPANLCRLSKGCLTVSLE